MMTKMSARMSEMRRTELGPWADEAVRRNGANQDDNQEEEGHHKTTHK